MLHLIGDDKFLLATLHRLFRFGWLSRFGLLHDFCHINLVCRFLCGRFLSCSWFLRFNGIAHFLRGQWLIVGHGFLAAHHFSGLACVLLIAEYPASALAVFPTTGRGKASLASSFLGKLFHGTLLVGCQVIVKGEQ